MKQTFIAVVENQSFKITSVRKFTHVVVARHNVDDLISRGDAFSAEKQAQFQAMKDSGKKFDFFLDSWSSRLDLAQRKAAALRNVVHDGVPVYVDIQIVEVKPFYGLK